VLEESCALQRCSADFFFFFFFFFITLLTLLILNIELNQERHRGSRYECVFGLKRNLRGEKKNLANFAILITRTRITLRIRRY
jgi:hypothetical protein